MDKKIVDTRDKNLDKEKALIKEATNRWEDADQYESTNHAEGRDDLMMLAGRNHWPEEVVEEREKDGRPCLMVNKLPSFTDQVSNDSRLNKRAIKVLPYGKGATREVADLLGGIIRQIENDSHAEIAYQTGHDGAVNNGFGYIGVTTQYADDESFDQVVRIRRIRNPFSVRMDPMCVEHDASDARYWFIEENISADEYEVRYPNLDPPSPINNPDDVMHRWANEKTVKVAEYWVKRPRKKRLYLLSDNRTVDGDEWDKVEVELQDEYQSMLDEFQAIMTQNPQAEVPPPPEPPTVVRKRDVDSYYIEQYLIDKDKIIEGPTEWAGMEVNIIPVWGKEIVIDDERILRSLIRFAKDPQRMYDYFRTAAAETVALAPKAPYVMEEGQIEGHEEEWNSANRKNKAVLLYKAVPGEGRPQRQVVTQTAVGEITESNISNDEMKATTSMFDASLGAQGNEVSGKAILARQREGDVAHFAFHDNLNLAIARVGEVLVDLIPRIYDTERQLIIMQEDGTDKTVTINQVVKGVNGGDVIINDLSLGKYKVTVKAGPSFTTARVEAAASMLDFVRTAPDAAVAMLDLIAENMDWPGAAKIAKRVKKMFLPPGIDDEGPLPPPEPDIDDVIKKSKAESISLGNYKKQLDIVQQRRELEGRGPNAATRG